MLVPRAAQTAKRHRGDLGGVLHILCVGIGVYEKGCPFICVVIQKVVTVGGMRHDPLVFVVQTDKSQSE